MSVQFGFAACVPPVGAQLGVASLLADGDALVEALGAGLLAEGAGGLLADGAGLLAEGAGLLADGAGLLADGAGLLAVGAGLLADGVGLAGGAGGLLWCLHWSYRLRPAGPAVAIGVVDGVALFVTASAPLRLGEAVELALVLGQSGEPKAASFDADFSANRTPPASTTPTASRTSIRIFRR